MSFLAVVYVVLLIVLAVWGGWTYDAGNPRTVGGVGIVWVMLAILGWVVFGGGATVVVR